jgi:hypothetical protein
VPVLNQRVFNGPKAMRARGSPLAVRAGLEKGVVGNSVFVLSVMFAMKVGLGSKEKLLAESGFSGFHCARH